MIARTTALSLILAAAAGVLPAQDEERMIEAELEEKLEKAGERLAELQGLLWYYTMLDQPFPEQLSEVDGEIPEDPFGSDPLKSAILPDESSSTDYSYVIYSVGPDGDDDGGRVVYDPADGSYSDGDIVVHVGEASVSVRDPSVQEKVRQSEARFAKIRDALIAYAAAEDEFPSALSALTAPAAYLDTVPADPFAPDEPLKLRVEPKERAIIYSVGPDRDDDGGERRAPIDEAENAAEADGDLLLTVSWEDVRRYARASADPDSMIGSEWAAALRELREETERENAFLQYYDAALKAPGPPLMIHDNAARAVIAGDYSQADVARKWIELWKPAFGPLERGAALDQAYGLAGREGYATPSANLLFVTNASRALLADAMLALEEGDTERTLQRLTTALRFGRDFLSEGTNFIEHIMGNGLATNAAETASRAIASGKLSGEELRELADELYHIEGSRAPMTAAVRTERDQFINHLRKNREDLPPNALEEINALLKEQGEPPLDALPDWERTEKIITDFYSKVIADLEKPHYKRDYEAPPLPQNLSSIERNMLDTALEMDHLRTLAEREAATTAHLRIARTAALAQVHAAEHGSLPSAETLAELLGGRLPADPFTGEPLSYATSGEGTCRIWSVGPDGADQDGLVRYSSSDPDAGGDIIYPPAAPGAR